ncbi:Uncharacterised protein [Chryseobacterium nakagawai]|uniref:Glycosyltransferase RgtA/B/C/D-like domain-containing protein n=1 Tax=Chryseobacterium nakagawai TaxID=1241982 RepID=A0AAD0YHP5_CHRNA|nr:glycosyltransferase family 39 protein [Chryseobacterium nakagawai]AZA89305.1 hypothetical protein EG343_01005 [Chryseobacterium nakagawai]VEH20648.1 Uncharacterised protein [Chryseobacterium nakagawai]
MRLGYLSFFFIATIIFSLGCFYYFPFFSDDSLISLRYAQRFIEGKGLTWNDGQPVEGYSNLLWVLGLSALGKLGMDLILAARVLGIVCSLGTIGSILYYFRNKNIQKEYVFLGVVLLVTTPSFAVWAIGGLEQPLYVLLLALILIEVSKIINDKNFRTIYLLSFWLGLLTLTRPDGFLFTLLTSGFLLVTCKKSKKQFITIGMATAIIPSLFLLGQLVFRYNFYGELVPNTALVKVKVTIHHILRGGFYNFKAFFSTLLLSGLGGLSLYYLVRKELLFGYYLLVLTAAWVGYVTLVGGDIFPAFRHYYVVLILFVFSIILGLQYFKKINLTSKKVSLSLIFLIVINAFIQSIIPDNQRATDERWEFRGMKLGETLKKTFPNSTLVAVTAAGCIPYSSELPIVDMLGLNDYYIPRHPPKNFGNGSLAHELGDANYVMNRNPDIIIFHIGGELNFNIGDQLKSNKVFNNNYIKVKTKEKDQEYQLFFNKYGKNTGIKNNGNQLIIPGYLFQASSDNLSIFSGNKLVKRMDKGKSYTLSLDHLSSGNWKISGSEEKIVDFNTNIHIKNGQLTIEIIPQSNMFLESIVLEREY